MLLDRWTFSCFWLILRCNFWCWYNVFWSDTKYEVDLRHTPDTSLHSQAVSQLAQLTVDSFLPKECNSCARANRHFKQNAGREWRLEYSPEYHLASEEKADTPLSRTREWEPGPPCSWRLKTVYTRRVGAPYLGRLGTSQSWGVLIIGGCHNSLFSAANFCSRKVQTLIYSYKLLSLQGANTDLQLQTFVLARCKHWFTATNFCSRKVQTLIYSYKLLSLQGANTDTRWSLSQGHRGRQHHGYEWWKHRVREVWEPSGPAAGRCHKVTGVDSTRAWAVGAPYSRDEGAPYSWDERAPYSWDEGTAYSWEAGPPYPCAAAGAEHSGGAGGRPVTACSWASTWPSRSLRKKFSYSSSKARR